ncbi:MAG TPA: MqnA/MqnD/SBP family protein, partial [Vicingaceae bacterium]|nr:MqnA/MqnD/SBP family protein [Vicingaceae bacterium]
PYMKLHAQEMDEQVMMQHVDLYVNKYSIDLGEAGRAAVTKMFNLAQQKGVIPKIKNFLFV